MTDLPPDGDLTLGLVGLGSGRRLRGSRLGVTPAPEVLWMTDDRFEDAGGLWWFLHDQTDLIPLILDSLDDDAQVGHRRPWEEDLDLMGGAVPGPDAVEEILRSSFWDDRDEDDHPSVSPAPFTAFPGLSPGVVDPLPPTEIANVMMGQAPGWIGLAAADRPADAPRAIGWFGCSDAFTLGDWGRWNPADAMTALLRSWEDRFGAKPVRLGFASMELLVERPPRTEEQAMQVAGELWGVADEFHPHGGDHAVRSVREIAGAILGSPIWHFWWD
jgi:hypothetical protein